MAKPYDSVEALEARFAAWKEMMKGITLIVPEEDKRPPTVREMVVRKFPKATQLNTLVEAECMRFRYSGTRTTMKQVVEECYKEWGHLVITAADKFNVLEDRIFAHYIDVKILDLGSWIDVEENTDGSYCYFCENTTKITLPCTDCKTYTCIECVEKAVKKYKVKKIRNLCKTCAKLRQ